MDMTLAQLNGYLAASARAESAAMTAAATAARVAQADEKTWSKIMRRWSRG
jgi:hypothetical protein